MKTTKRKGLGSESGQVLPITVLFMGVIIGAAAISIDVAKVSALRNQAQTATSAAALAAAQTLANDVSGTAGSTDPTTAADTVYQDNIRSAIGNSGLNNNPTVTYSLGSPNGTLIGSLPAKITLPIYIHVRAAGTTPMNFGQALGISTAKVDPESTAVVGDQVAIGANSYAPFLLPEGDWKVGCTYNIIKGPGDASPPPSNCPTSSSQLVFAPGSFGWLSGTSSALYVAPPNPGIPPTAMPTGAYDYVTTETGAKRWDNPCIVFKNGCTTGSEPTFTFPEGYLPTYRHEFGEGHNNSIPISGFLTAKIVGYGQQYFTIEVLANMAQSTQNIGQGPNSSAISYSLVPNN